MLDPVNDARIKEALDLAMMRGMGTAATKFLGKMAPTIMTAARPAMQSAVKGVQGAMAGPLAQNIAQGAKSVGRGLFSHTAPTATGAKGMAQHAVQTVRGMAFGSPIDLANKVKTLGTDASGKMSLGRGLQGLASKHFLPGANPEAKGLLGKAFDTASRVGAIAHPAYQMYQASQAPAEERGAARGRAAAAIAMSPITSHLGIPGMALTHAATRVGGRIGGMFDPKKPQPPQQTPDPGLPPYSGMPYDYRYPQ